MWGAQDHTTGRRLTYTQLVLEACDMAAVLHVDTGSIVAFRGGNSEAWVVCARRSKARVPILLKVPLYGSFDVYLNLSLLSVEIWLDS